MDKNSRIILDIDLKTKKTKKSYLPKSLKNYGGRFLTSYFISKEIDPSSHPLDHENNFYIAPGFFVGDFLP
jgi:aldehyde:ferredoxin oxidoreductase